MRGAGRPARCRRWAHEARQGLGRWVRGRRPARGRDHGGRGPFARPGRRRLLDRGLADRTIAAGEHARRPRAPGVPGRRPGRHARGARRADLAPAPGGPQEDRARSPAAGRVLRRQGADVPDPARLDAHPRGVLTPGARGDGRDPVRLGDHLSGRGQAGREPPGRPRGGQRPARQPDPDRRPVPPRRALRWRRRQVRRAGVAQGVPPAARGSAARGQAGLLTCGVPPVLRRRTEVPRVLWTGPERADIAPVKSLFERAADALDRTRTGDGFGPTAGADPEPEPTALAALALDDDDARTWLAQAQREDGSLGVWAGPFDNDSPTALAALALPAGPARERALDHVLSNPARRVPADRITPHDPNLAGWGWADGTAGWVEPTARTLLAMRLLRPNAAGAIEQAAAFLADRECVDGGWNYGNRVVYGLPLPAFGQPTAVALVGLHGMTVNGSDGDLVTRGVDALRRLWPVERGPLTLGTALAAFRLLDLADAEDVAAELDNALDAPNTDVIALAWIGLASGPGLTRLAVA